MTRQAEAGLLPSPLQKSDNADFSILKISDEPRRLFR